ncbi:hypothetical protein NHX12_001367 [Muraenolepis orangiensis]|uniref:Uncharacterized protein n=1 Tax=Muraenolepis orangiensis TaxID=630683 RepID=A0A9Q0II33_9TELE|nr:hypothetical protein NHX12_001367 [Muraenolepis orangiensis]
MILAGEVGLFPTPPPALLSEGPSADICLSAVTCYLCRGHWGQNTAIDPVNIDGPNGIDDEREDRPPALLFGNAIRAPHCRETTQEEEETPPSVLTPEEETPPSVLTPEEERRPSLPRGGRDTPSLPRGGRDKAVCPPPKDETRPSALAQRWKRHDRLSVFLWSCVSYPTQGRTLWHRRRRRVSRDGNTLRFLFDF